MAVLFVSHSSRDDILATAVEAWLKSNGFTDIFVDHESMAGGDKWRDELRKAANTCRVVVCLVTGNWLASTECFNEFMAAWYMGRRIIPLLLLPQTGTLGDEARQRLERVLGEDQGVDLTPCFDPPTSLDLARDQSVASRLKTGLLAASSCSTKAMSGWPNPTAAYGCATHCLWLCLSPVLWPEKCPRKPCDKLDDVTTWLTKAPVR